MHADIIFPDITSTLQITGCHFGQKPAGWSYPKHHHHLYELLYCQEGTAELLINGAAVSMRSGDWLFIRAGVRHQVEAGLKDNGHFSFFNIHFDIDDIEMRKRLSTFDYSLHPVAAAASTRLSDHVREIERIMHASMLGTPQVKAETERRLTLTYEQKILLQASILLIIFEIIQLQSREIPEEHKAVRGKRDTTIHETDTAHNIEERLQRLAAEDGSITQIAEELNMSRSQCTKIFTKIYGISPRQYVIQLKLNKAKFLLIGTSRTIEDIANELVFHSVSHFSRQFHRGTGMSPNQFRPRR